MFELSNFKDLDETTAPLAKQYYELFDSGKYDEAVAFLSEHNELAPCLIGSEWANKIEHDIYNLAEQYYYSQKIIFSDEEPKPEKEEMYIGSEWYQEYE